MVATGRGRPGQCPRALLGLSAAVAMVSTGKASAGASGDPRIEHFVVLYMENRPFDHMFGCMDLPGADSAATMTRNRSLPIDPHDPTKGSVNVTYVRSLRRLSVSAYSPLGPR